MAIDIKIFSFFIDFKNVKFYRDLIVNLHINRYGT